MTDARVDATRGRVTLTDARVDPTRGRVTLTDARVDPTRGRVTLTDARFDPTRGRLTLTRASVAATRASVASTRFTVATTRFTIVTTRATIATTRFPVATMDRLAWAGACSAVPGFLRPPWVASLSPGRQVAGITDDAPVKLSTELCGLPYGTAACAACVHTSCCAESNACAGDPSCAAYQACFGPCNGDPACWSQCIIDHPATGADVSALSACMASQCEAACDLTCGGFAGRPFPPSTAAACKSCLAQNACAQTRACATSIGCDTAIRCINASPTYDLINTCELTDGVNPSWGWNPDAGSGNALTQYFVAQSSCGPACAGTDWHCVGHLNWPPLGSVSTPYTMNLLVRDYSSSSPEPGATVDVCGDTDVDCSMPYQHGTTGVDGEIALPFQNVSATSAGGHGLEGYLKISGADLEPNYLYWGSPLSGSSLYTLAEVTTLSEVAALNEAVHVTPDPTRGSVAVSTFDCQFGSAAGVEVTLDTADSATQSFSTTFASTTVTDSSGIIIFTNVPAGAVQVTATPPGMNRASSHVSATVRPQAGTTVYAYPTP